MTSWRSLALIVSIAFLGYTSSWAGVCDQDISLDDLRATLNIGTSELSNKQLTDVLSAPYEGEAHGAEGTFGDATYRTLVQTTLCAVEIGRKVSENETDPVILDAFNGAANFFQKLGLKGAIAILSQGSLLLGVAGTTMSLAQAVGAGETVLRGWAALFGSEARQAYFFVREGSSPDDDPSHDDAINKIAMTSNSIQAKCALATGSIFRPDPACEREKCVQCRDKDVPEYLRTLYADTYLYGRATEAKGELRDLLIERANYDPLRLSKSTVVVPQRGGTSWSWRALVDLGLRVLDPAPYVVLQGIEILLERGGVELFRAQLDGSLLNATTTSNGTTVLQYRDPSGTRDGITRFSASSRDGIRWTVQFTAKHLALPDDLGSESLGTVFTVGSVVASSEGSYQADKGRVTFKAPCANGRSQVTYYRDADGDGYGDTNASTLACTSPAGYVARAGDCNDSSRSLRPGAVETCDGVDNNCNNQVDDGIAVACYSGPAGTLGIGACKSGSRSCVNASLGACMGETLPGPEVCGDSIDNNCDGYVDEGCPTAQNRIVFVSHGLLGVTKLVTVNPDGTDLLAMDTPCQSAAQPAWSPDRARIAFACAANLSTNIAVVDADAMNFTQLTQVPGNETASQPAWSPDGSRLAFQCTFISQANFSFFNLCTMNSDGTGRQSLKGNASSSPAWSPSGASIAFAHNPLNLDPLLDVYTINPDGTGFQDVTNTPLALCGAPAWSPDGSRLAFDCSHAVSGVAAGIYVMNSDGSNRTHVNSTVAAPSWSPDGTKIVFAYFSDLFVMNPDGSGVTQLTTGGTYSTRQGSWR